MPNSNPYQLVTLKSAILLLGDDWLVGELTHRFQAQNFQVITNVSQISSDIDIDYLLIQAGYLPEETVINHLFQHYSPKSFYLHHYTDNYLPDTISQFHQIIYPDCIGLYFSHAPILDKLLTEVVQHHQLFLSQGGLIDYQFITDLILKDLIFQVIIQSQLTQKLITIPTPTISFLSLANLIQTHLTYKLNLNLHSSSFVYPNYSAQNSSLFNSTNFINQDYTSQFNQYFKTYFNHHQTQSKSNFPITKSIVKPKLSRLSDLVSPIHQPNKPRSKQPKSKSASHLAFVPISSPQPIKKRHFKFTFPKFKLPKPLSIVSGGIALALILYTLTIVASLTFTYLNLKSLKANLNHSSLPSKKSLQIARIPAVFLEANLVAISSLPGISHSAELKQLTSFATYYRHGLDSLLIADQLANVSTNLLSYILGPADGDILSLINQARLLSSELYESLSLLDGALPVKPPSIIPKTHQRLYSDLKSNLSLLRSSTLTAKTLLATAPDLLGVGSRKKYLVLFQNNMELRPTGGFIGSFALISFENGKLYDMPIYDVYSADGQLKGHVEPPELIKKYLGEANWYLRDSNWDPDFPTSARRAEWFLEKTMDQQVNGTVAVNVYTLASLLKALGPIHLPDYDEAITADNIFERAEYHAEVNFFPGSSQKKEFLSSVAEVLFNQLNNLSIQQALPVAQALIRSIDEKNTLISLDSTKLEHAFSTLGWNGQLRHPGCPNLGANCYLDYAMLVDANLGVNKANYFVNRSLKQTINLDKNLTPYHILSVKYQNTSTSTSWPAGNYKNYVRLYLPPDTILDSVSIDNQVIPHEKLTLSSDHNRFVVGLLVNVPIQTTVTLKINYHRSTSLSSSQPLYSFYWQKQSGTAGDPLNFELNYPLFLQPDLISPQAQLKPQQLSFSLTNITDRRITVKFNSN